MKDLCQRVSDYKMLGEKAGDYKGFETINYCEKLINDYTPEEVEAYHPGFAKLFKWLVAAIALRKQDIIRRKAIAKRDKEAREAKIAEKEQRALNREQAILEANEKFLSDNADNIDKFTQFKALCEARDRGDEMDEAS